MLDALKPALAPLILRMGLGTIFVSHGYFKIETGADHWHPDLNPTVLTIVAWAEMVGGIALFLGLLTRLAALGIAIIQIGAILTVTGQREFIYMKDILGGSKEHGLNFTQVGYEYNFAIIVMCLVAMILGSGLVSVDYLLFGRRKAAAAARQASHAPGQAPAAPANVTS